MMVDDDRFDDLMRDAARSYRVPPEPPLDAMWVRIEQAHFGRARVARRARLRWRTWLSLAASLLLGVGI